MVLCLVYQIIDVIVLWLFDIICHEGHIKVEYMLLLTYEHSMNSFPILVTCLLPVNLSVYI